jgi:hypothetical protein
MNQGKTRLFCVAEHPLRVGMVLVALIWVIGSLVETLVSSDGTLPSMLLPAQSEQTWDHRLLALVVLFFACYTRRDQGMNDTDRYAALRYPRLDYGVVSSVLTRPPVYTGSTVTHEQGLKPVSTPAKPLAGPPATPSRTPSHRRSTARNPPTKRQGWSVTPLSRLRSRSSWIRAP